MVKESAFSHWESHLSSGSCGFHLWVGKSPWRRKWPPTPVFLPGESHGHRSLAGYSLGGHKQSERTEWARAHARIGWFTPFFSLPFLYPLSRKLGLHLHLHKGLHIACLRYTQRSSSREHSQARGPEKTSSKEAKGYFGKESQGCEYSKCNPEG